MANPIDVYLERGEKRVFACAVEWPGWCRSGRTDDEALEALVTYAGRYAAVAKLARVRFRKPRMAGDLNVVDRLDGGSGTDFGIPAAAPPADERALGGAELKRGQSLLEAAWETFDAAAEAARGVELRKGPRGGGRNLRKIVTHVLDAERAYLHELGERYSAPSAGVEAQMVDVRRAALEFLAARAKGAEPQPGPRRTKPFWGPRYFARRSAWHALDHAWEIEDRAQPEP
jgi:hypothetical protein